MAMSLSQQLERWQAAGLIDGATAERIRSWEARNLGPSAPSLRIPTLVAVSLGGVLLAAGVLLLVSTHWEALSPGQQFSLLLALLLVLHGLGAGLGTLLPALAVALHGVGSVALGAGIFLTGQIFHLEARWPLGLLLWGLGAGLGWWLLRQWPQLALLALLAPAWLAGEWLLRCEQVMGTLPRSALLPMAAGLVLTSLAYLGAAQGPGPCSPPRRVLVWVGGLALPGSAVFWEVTLITPTQLQAGPGPDALLLLLGWSGALLLPLLAAWRWRGRSIWHLAVAVGWVLAGLAITFATTRWAVPLIHYPWWIAGGLLLVGWGVVERRTERINFGAAFIASTVLGFYVSNVMGNLERSASLVGLGVLFLGGGWGLEVWRRRLLASMQGKPQP
ncbi:MULTISPECIES: DUF2157 domain-containing protein [Aphanothece]|uniref:DUF2157 domain-containing protein n=1 Tax=Aphanothece TaxID=1121 RepID=UPI0039848B96